MRRKDSFDKTCQGEMKAKFLQNDECKDVNDASTHKLGDINNTLCVVGSAFIILNMHG